MQNVEPHRTIYFVWTYLDWGGAQIYFIAIMKTARTCWDIVVVLPCNSSLEILRYLDQIGVRYEFIDVEIDTGTASPLKRHWRHISNHIATYRFLRKYDLCESILHIEITPWQSLMFLTALSMRGANVFVTLHNALSNLPRWRIFLWKAKMQFISRLRGFHIFTSNKSAKDHFKGWVEPKFWQNIKITYTGVNPVEIDEALHSEFDGNAVRSKFNIDETSFVVLCVGQFIDRKGRWVFLEAAKIALRENPDLKFVWLTPKLPDQDEVGRIAEYGLGDSFRLVLSSSVGSTRHEILRFFRIADAFTLPSFIEGLPIALLEAMAIGIPSISTNINAIPEAIVDGETGILIGPDDSDTLSRRILELKNNTELRQKLSTNGRAYVIEHFDEREASRIAIDAYEECFANVD